MNVDYRLQTEDGHELALYTRGNPEKPAVIFCHGGPGGAISEQSFSFFDLESWFVIAFDQRGCGQSTPFLSLNNNTVFSGAADMERIRKFFRIDHWLVFGGSYGSTLALTYAIAHPERVVHLILRGIFLGRQADIHWLYQEGASYFYPEEHDRFKTLIPMEKQGHLIDAYDTIFRQGSPAEREKALKNWALWEGSIVRHIPEQSDASALTPGDRSLALLECHFFVNGMFDDDNYILNHASRYQDIPMSIVHGRYDVDCRVSAAYELHQVSNSRLFIEEASGHSPYDSRMMQRLQQIMIDLSHPSE